MITKIAPKYFLGSLISNPKIYASKVDEIIDVLNSLTSQIETINSTIVEIQALLPTADQKAAMDAANSPDSENAFATINDLP